MGFSRQEYWSGLLFPSPGELPDPGISCIGRWILYHWTTSEVLRLFFFFFWRFLPKNILFSEALFSWHLGKGLSGECNWSINMRDQDTPQALLFCENRRGEGRNLPSRWTQREKHVWCVINELEWHISRNDSESQLLYFLIIKARTFELWCWRTFLKVPWTANRSILKEITPEYSLERTDTEAPILWPPDVKNQLIGKDPDAGNDWRQKEKRATEDEMVRYITNSMNMNLSKLWEKVENRGAWRATVHEVPKNQHDWATTTKARAELSVKSWPPGNGFNQVGPSWPALQPAEWIPVNSI